MCSPEQTGQNGPHMNRLIALAMTGPRFVDELMRAWDAGDAILPIDLRLPMALQRELVESMGAAEIVDQDGNRSKTGTGFPVEPGDAAVIATSGTTGTPKGVVHTHQSILASAERTSEALGVSTNDHWLCCLPVAHIGGLSVITRALLTSTKLTVHGGFDTAEVTRAAHQGVTLVSLVTAALERIEPSLFRLILLGGAAPPAARPPNAIATYGMTETGSGIIYEKTPLRDVEIRISRSNEIEVSSPTLFRCYRDGSDPKDNGWFATGDAGDFLDGELRVHGRMSEVINTGGEKVWPAAVETALSTHPSVGATRVFGEPDPTWGQNVIAEIELRPNAVAPPLEELRDHVKQTLPAYATPRAVRIVDAIERTPTGKIRRPLSTS